MHQPTPRDGEAVPLPQERHDCAERESELFVEHDDQRDHLPAELRGGRADRVRRLQGMPPLDAMAASIAAADIDVTLADRHARDLPEAGSPRLVHLSFQMIDLLAPPIVLSREAIMLALRLVALALGTFRPFSQVFDLTSRPIVQGWVA